MNTVADIRIPIMSFRSSGGAPYRMYATFLGREFIDSGEYILTYRTMASVGTCPVSPLGSAPNNMVRDGLYNTGTWLIGGSEPIGNCRNLELRLTKASDGSIFQISNAYINNT